MNHQKNIDDYRDEINRIGEEIENGWDRGDRSFVRSAEARVEELEEAIRWEEKLMVEEGLQADRGEGGEDE
jgi:hypothetical protein